MDGRKNGKKTLTKELDLLKVHPQTDISYGALRIFFAKHAFPARKIQDLEKHKFLIRLKKGFYIISPKLSGHDVQTGIVANLLYGPSYLSLEYALSFYGLIPERVSNWTSVTLKKNKDFLTPLGGFTYSHVGIDLFPLAVTMKETSDSRHFLMATVEKALLDHVMLRRKQEDILNLSDVKKYLQQDLRIHLKDLTKIISLENLSELRPLYVRRKRARLLIDFLIDLKERSLQV